MSGVTTFASVTEQPCACGYLQREADDVASPIVFDATMNEYHFEYPSPCANGACDAAKARMVIYHCPFCGGLAPPSKRPHDHALPKQLVSYLIGGPAQIHEYEIRRRWNVLNSTPG